jgi:hypothetical protein
MSKAPGGKLHTEGGVGGISVASSKVVSLVGV